ncbi:rCG61339, isoform CRA_a [Rattus norvegicus]|uniref:RCG61339, isoform CRA_a n=1 Tax=Rattus norvegicus TaxID=10116 RepID=A6HAE5_RAT|nr:rCG61339, isoform CRA_a [Rattus norvegicus]
MPHLQLPWNASSTKKETFYFTCYPNVLEDCTTHQVAVKKSLLRND